MKILVFWTDEKIRAILNRFVPDSEIRDGSADLEKLVDQPIEPAPAVVVCGQPPEGITPAEVAQSLGLAYQSSALVFIETRTGGFDRENLKKNGFTDAFLTPFEDKDLERFLGKALAAAESAAKRYRNVNLIDLNENEELDFDVYIHLPLNNKHVKIASSGRKLRPEQLERLREHQQNAVQIRETDLDKFYQFTAQQLASIGSNETMSQTQKEEMLQQTVRSIVGGLFSQTEESASFDSGRKILDDCQGIVKNFIKSSGLESAPLFERLTNLSRDGSDSYRHATNVSTVAALLSIGLQIGKPDEMALAGLLHDIGRSMLPEGFQSLKDKAEPEKDESYRKHAEFSIELLKSKRIVMPERVVQIIQQHHENYDGSGFPAGLKLQKVLPEAQIIGFADDLDELVAVEAGQRAMKPGEAFNHLLSKELNHPNGRRLAPEIARKIIKVLGPKQNPAS